MSKGVISKGFMEEYGATDEVEPTETSFHDFDFNAVEAALGENPLTEDDAHRLRFAMGFIIDWLLSVDLNDHRALKTIGKRAIAMAWVLEPKRFGEHASLRSLSKQLGFTAPNIAPITSEFSRLTKIVNKFQAHDWRGKQNQ